MADSAVLLPVPEPDLSELSELERSQILSVIHRDEEFRNTELSRVEKLQREILQLKEKVKSSSEAKCARCLEEFFWIIRRGDPCPQCQCKVCEKCRCLVATLTVGQLSQTTSSKWLCVLCYKELELQLMSGSWFYHGIRIRRSRRSRRTLSDTGRLEMNEVTAVEQQQLRESVLHEASDTESSEGWLSTGSRRSKQAIAHTETNTVAFPQGDDQLVLNRLVSTDVTNASLQAQRTGSQRSVRYDLSNNNVMDTSADPSQSKTYIGFRSRTLNQLENGNSVGDDEKWEIISTVSSVKECGRDKPKVLVHNASGTTKPVQSRTVSSSPNVEGTKPAARKVVVVKIATNDTKGKTSGNGTFPRSAGNAIQPKIIDRDITKANVLDEDDDDEIFTETKPNSRDNTFYDNMSGDDDSNDDDDDDDDDDDSLNEEVRAKPGSMLPMSVRAREYIQSSSAVTYSDDDSLSAISECTEPVVEDLLEADNLSTYSLDEMVNGCDGEDTEQIVDALCQTEMSKHSVNGGIEQDINDIAQYNVQVLQDEQNGISSAPAVATKSVERFNWQQSAKVKSSQLVTVDKKPPEMRIQVRETSVSKSSQQQQQRSARTSSNADSELLAQNVGVALPRLNSGIQSSVQNTGIESQTQNAGSKLPEQTAGCIDSHSQNSAAKPALSVNVVPATPAISTSANDDDRSWLAVDLDPLKVQSDRLAIQKLTARDSAESQTDESVIDDTDEDVVGSEFYFEMGNSNLNNKQQINNGNSTKDANEYGGDGQVISEDEEYVSVGPSESALASRRDTLTALVEEQLKHPASLAYVETGNKSDLTSPGVTVNTRPPHVPRQDTLGLLASEELQQNGGRLQSVGDIDKIVDDNNKTLLAAKQRNSSDAPKTNIMGHSQVVNMSSDQSTGNSSSVELSHPENLSVNDEVEVMKRLHVPENNSKIHEDSSEQEFDSAFVVDSDGDVDKSCNTSRSGFSGADDSAIGNNATKVGELDLSNFKSQQVLKRADGSDLNEGVSKDDSVHCEVSSVQLPVAVGAVSLSQKPIVEAQDLSKSCSVETSTEISRSTRTAAAGANDANTVVIDRPDLTPNSKKHKVILEEHSHLYRDDDVVIVHPLAPELKVAPGLCERGRNLEFDDSDYEAANLDENCDVLKSSATHQVNQSQNAANNALNDAEDISESDELQLDLGGTYAKSGRRPILTCNTVTHNIVGDNESSVGGRPLSLSDFNQDLEEAGMNISQRHQRQKLEQNIGDNDINIGAAGQAGMGTIVIEDNRVNVSEITFTADDEREVERDIAMLGRNQAAAVNVGDATAGSVSTSLQPAGLSTTEQFATPSVTVNSNNSVTSPGLGGSISSPAAADISGSVSSPLSPVISGSLASPAAPDISGSLSSPVATGRSGSTTLPEIAGSMPSPEAAGISGSVSSPMPRGISGSLSGTASGTAVSSPGTHGISGSFASPKSPGMEASSGSLQSPAISMTSVDQSMSFGASNDSMISSRSSLSPSHSLAIPSLSVSASENIDDVDEAFSVNSPSSPNDVDFNKLHAVRPKSQLSSKTSGSQESITSTYSNPGLIGDITVTGDICFQVTYNKHYHMLEVLIAECRNLAAVSTRRKTSNPYVKIYLLPDKTKSGKRKTKVARNTLNPNYQQTLQFDVSKTGIESRTLWLSIWHNDRLGRNVFLGDVILPFTDYDFSSPKPEWHKLQQQGRELWKSEWCLAQRAELQLSLQYVTADTVAKSRGGKGKPPAKGELRVNIKQAFNLVSAKDSGNINPFCKVRLLSAKQTFVRQKTPIIKHNFNPVWNHEIAFADVSQDELRSGLSLELTMWDHERFTTSSYLGGFQLNSGGSVEGVKDWVNSEGEEIDLWIQMLQNPNKVAEGKLHLRPSDNTS